MLLLDSIDESENINMDKKVTTLYSAHKKVVKQS